MSLKKLHEDFIERANRPMTFGALPVSPQEVEPPIMPVNRWHEAAGALHKTYAFRRMSDRDAFVMQLLSYESSVGHNAGIYISGGSVSLKLQTHDIGKPTELDREYARYADVLFRELVYSSTHGTEARSVTDPDE